MANALTFLSDAEKKQLEQAIVEVENDTAAEIVCAVATESGRYDRAEGICGFLLAVLLLGFANWSSGQWQSEPGDFSLHPGLAFGWQVLAVTLGFVAGNLVASYFHPLRRLLTSQAEMEAETAKAASHLFTVQRVYTTRKAAGLLIYVSLVERQVVVLADDGVLQLLGQAFLDELRDSAATRLHNDQGLEAFLDAIKEAGTKLSESLPRGDEEVNELQNHLVCIHPRP